MADKKQKDSEEAIKKIFEKYGNDPNKLAEAYSELQAKLSSQGDEVGTLRKKTEESQSALKQYEEYIKQLTPVVNWYNNPDTQAQLQAYNAWIMNQQQAANQPQPNQYQNGSNGAVGILQPEEVNQLYDSLGKRWDDEKLKPALEQLTKQWSQKSQELVNQAIQAADQKIKAFSDVQWKIQERTTPKEVLEQMKQYQEAALKFADPKNHDPMQFASEFLDLQKDRDTLKSELEEMRQKVEKADQDSLGLVNGSPNSGSSFFADADEEPGDRQSRFSAVVKETQDAIGTQKFREAFPGS